MQTKGIPKQLRIKIRRFMETLYEHKSGFDEQVRKRTFLRCHLYTKNDQFTKTGSGLTKGKHSKRRCFFVQDVLRQLPPAMAQELLHYMYLLRSILVKLRLSGLARKSQKRF